MFCTEPIEKVFESLAIDAPSDADDCFDWIDRFVWHVTSGYALFFQTAGSLIYVGSDGVRLLPRDAPELSNWPMDEYEDLTTLFAGEHIVSVSEPGETYEIVFDDFTLGVRVWPAGEMPHGIGDNGLATVPAHGYDRLLIRRCSCGGRGQVLFDFVDDSLVRCSSCHYSTPAYGLTSYAIRDWNCGNTPCRVELLQEHLDEYHGRPVWQIAVGTPFHQYTPGSCDCWECIVELDDIKITAQYRYFSEAHGGLSLGELGWYNPDHFPALIRSSAEEPITLLSELYHEDGCLYGLKFSCGDRYLFLFSLENSLVLTKSIADLTGDLNDLPETDDSVLFTK